MFQLRGRYLSHVGASHIHFVALQCRLLRPRLKVGDGVQGGAGEPERRRTLLNGQAFGQLGLELQDVAVGGLTFRLALLCRLPPVEKVSFVSTEKSSRELYRDYNWEYWPLVQSMFLAPTLNFIHHIILLLLNAGIKYLKNIASFFVFKTGASIRNFV